MAKTFVSLSEPTVELIITLKHDPEETFDAVVRRELGKANNGGVTRNRPLFSKEPTEPKVRPIPRSGYSNGHGYGIELLGQKMEAVSAREAMTTALEALQNLDATFLERFSAEKGRTRRFVARKPEALYPGRPDLAHLSVRICGSWYVGTNYSRRDIRRILQTACEVAGLQYARDLVFIEPSVH